MELVRQFDQPPLGNARKALALKRIDTRQRNVRSLDPDNPPDEMYDVLNFFEHISLLANRGYLDKTDVWSEFGYWMFNFYADARPVIDNEQKDDPASFADFSSLMNDMRQIEIKVTKGASDHPSPEDIYGFYVMEANAQPGAPIPQGHRKKK